MPKIDINTVKRIIREEISLISENEEYDSAAKLMSSAAKLLGAISDFKEVVGAKAKAELEDSMNSFESLLKRVAESPLKYVDTGKINPAVSNVQKQKVSVKPNVKKEIV